MWLPKIPLAEWVDTFVDFIKVILEPFFDFISEGIEVFVDLFVLIMSSIPALVIILLVAGLAWWLNRWPMALFTAVGLWLIHNLGYWEGTIDSWH